MAVRACSFPVSKLTRTYNSPHLSAHRDIQPGQRIYRPDERQDFPFALPKFAKREEDPYMEATIVLRPYDEAVQHGCILDYRNSDLFKLLIDSADGIESLRRRDILGYIYEMEQSCRKTQATQQIFEDLQRLHVAYVTGMLRFDKSIHLPPLDVTITTSSATFPFHMCGHTRTVASVAFLSNTQLASGSWDKTLRVWDVSTGEMTLGSSPLNGHSKDITCVAVHTSTGLVASASGDSTIRLWSSDSNGAIHTGKVLRDESSGLVYCVAFSPDASHLVSGSREGLLCVWDAARGELVGEPVRGHTDEWVQSIAFSPDGKKIVSGSRDRTVRVWEWLPDKVTLQPCGEPLNGHTHLVISVAFSPDAGVIASGSVDSTIRIWDVATRTSKFTLEGHTASVMSVAFAPSGMHLVSGSGDWTVRIWDPRTGAAVRVLRGHTRAIRSVSFSQDGTRIASGSEDNTVRVWDFVPPADESHANEDIQAEPAQIDPA